MSKYVFIQWLSSCLKYIWKIFHSNKLVSRRARLVGGRGITVAALGVEFCLFLNESWQRKWLEKSQYRYFLHRMQGIEFDIIHQTQHRSMPCSECLSTYPELFFNQLRWFAHHLVNHSISSKPQGSGSGADGKLLFCQVSIYDLWHLVLDKLLSRLLPQGEKAFFSQGSEELHG